MSFSVTFRHMDATDALKEYCWDKVDRLKKYFREPIATHVILSTERGYNHHAEFVIRLKNGILVRGEEATEDMYSSIDLAMAKIERQVRRWKDKIRDHKPSSTPGISVRHLVLDSGGLEPASERAPTPTPMAEEHVVSRQEYDVRQMTVSQAVMQMSLLHDEFLVFVNSDSRQVNVVYRRKDGHYGLIEAPAAAP